MYLAINFKVHRWIFIRKGCDVKKESLIVAQHAADYVWLLRLGDFCHLVLEASVAHHAHLHMYVHVCM